MNTSNRTAFEQALLVGRTGTGGHGLFLHDRNGLGKTHLLNAIGNGLPAVGNESVTLYATARQFDTACVMTLESTHPADIETFRSTYDRHDLLLLDDANKISRNASVLREFGKVIQRLIRQANASS